MEALNGKRIALAGFTPETTADLRSKFDAAMAFGRTIAEPDAAPGSKILDNFDLLVAGAAAAQPWFAVAGRESDIPLLVIGSPNELAPNLASLTNGRRDFLLNNPGTDDLQLRAASLLSGKADRRSPRRTPIVVTADDDLSITALVKALFDSDGVTCETANNGNDALNIARQRKPDVLVLDVNMPGLSGFEVLSAVKLDPATATTRVILLTGAEQESDIMRGFSLGASDYVVKPFNPMELLVRVRRFIRT